MSKLPLVGELDKNNKSKSLEQPEEEPLDNNLKHKNLELSEGDDELLE